MRFPTALLEERAAAFHRARQKAKRAEEVPLFPVGGWVGGWMDGWMDRWVGGWVDGWVGAAAAVFEVLSWWAGYGDLMQLILSLLIPALLNHQPPLPPTPKPTTQHQNI